LKRFKFLQNKAESLENCLENVKVVSERIYKRFSDEPVEAKDFNQTVSRQVEFLDRVIYKLTSDNITLLIESQNSTRKTSLLNFHSKT
jgi:Txe/YoeB family toxin of Txe-Axe toxin-antitoxin module